MVIHLASYPHWDVLPLPIKYQFSLIPSGVVLFACQLSLSMRFLSSLYFSPIRKQPWVVSRGFFSGPIYQFILSVLTHWNQSVWVPFNSDLHGKLKVKTSASSCYSVHATISCKFCDKSKQNEQAEETCSCSANWGEQRSRTLLLWGVIKWCSRWYSWFSLPQSIYVLPSNFVTLRNVNRKPSTWVIQLMLQLILATIFTCTRAVNTQHLTRIQRNYSLIGPKNSSNSLTKIQRNLIMCCRGDSWGT